MSLSPIEYLTRFKFEPHINGNYAACGLNSFGCDSTIRFNDNLSVIWRFVGCVGSQYQFTDKDDNSVMLSHPLDDANITRMQVCPPESLDPELARYLISVSQQTGEKFDLVKMRKLIDETGFNKRELLSVLHNGTFDLPRLRECDKITF